MNVGVGNLRHLSLLALLSCAPPPQANRTVEPAGDPQDQAGSGLIASGDDDGEIHENSAPEPASSGGEGAIGGEGSGDDSAFVASRMPRGPTPQDVQALPIHLNEGWWPFRAKFLGISEAQAKQRDAAISFSQAPKDFWDEQTALEAVSVWTVLCNECHGGRRKVEDALNMPVPAPAWGQGEGLFFGNRRTYRHVFDIVYNGARPPPGEERSEMIAWKKELSREQIWSLLYFLEYQSVGIEGRFPPSLYPRRSEASDEP